MKDLVILGAGGFAREVLWLIHRINQIEKQWNVLGFISSGHDSSTKMIDGYPLLGDDEEVGNYSDAFFICTVGSAKKRKNIIQKLKSSIPDIKFATLVDPSVIISESVQIGEGSCICASTILTVNISIGNHVHINLGCTVGHDAIIKDYVTVYPGVNISGAVKIESCTELGTGGQIIQGICVGENSIIGAGSTVIRDIPSDCTAVGSPAKVVKINESK